MTCCATWQENSSMIKSSPFIQCKFCWHSWLFQTILFPFLIFLSLSFSITYISIHPTLFIFISHAYISIFPAHSITRIFIIVTLSFFFCHTFIIFSITALHCLLCFFLALSFLSVQVGGKTTGSPRTLAGCRPQRTSGCHCSGSK